MINRTTTVAVNMVVMMPTQMVTAKPRTGGEPKMTTDFRRIYATQLDGWLGCDSKAVLGANWDHVNELETKA